MIILQATDTNPYYQNTIMTVLEGNIAATVTSIPALDFCICKYECEYIEPVFSVDAQGGKDTSSFIFKKQIPTDSVVWKLLKNGSEIALLNNNALGEYFTTFTTQPDQLGFRLDWDLVIQAHGAGIYTIQSEINQLGVPSTLTSRKYDLMYFSELAADGTVKIITYQNGNIKSSPIDYTGLNWKQSIRIRGKFGDRQPQLEINNYKDSTYNKQQIRDTIYDEWTLLTDLLIADITNELVYDSLLGNEVFISDYNLFNKEQYRDISVTFTGIEANNLEDNTKSTFNMTFEDRLQNNIKTNY